MYGVDHMVDLRLFAFIHFPGFVIELDMLRVIIGLFLGFNKVTLNLYFGRW